MMDGISNKSENEGTPGFKALEQLKPIFRPLDTTSKMFNSYLLQGFGR
jgi:hypothetical protein